jgi:hypothetical protein
MATYMEIDISNKRKQDEDAEMPPTKVFVVEFVPMEIDEPHPDPLILFPIPRLVRTVNTP